METRKRQLSLDGSEEEIIKRPRLEQDETSTLTSRAIVVFDDMYKLELLEWKKRILEDEITKTNIK